MPIYAYKCESCGHRKDVLQKMSDPLLTQCPACGAATFVKQVTAAGFQLKGSGWYVTDFRDGGAKKDKPAADGEGGASAGKSSDISADKPADKAADKPADAGASATAPAAKTGDGAKPSAPAAAPAPSAPSP